MARSNARDLVQRARENGGAVGAFNVILLEHAEALVLAAEQIKLPIILQISENCVKYHGALKPIAIASIAIAEAADVPVSIHLDHAEGEDLIRQALDLGFDSIMFDGSKLEYQENVRASTAIAHLCREYGASLEVEIGEIGGKDGVHAKGARTKPLEAKAFVQDTGADLLAVAVGTSHAMLTRDSALDFDLIRDISKHVSQPLVLHGSSGVSDEDLQRAVKAGMSKINIATHLNNVFTSAIRNALAKDLQVVDPRKYLIPSRQLLSDEVSRLLKLLATP